MSSNQNWQDSGDENYPKFDMIVLIIAVVIIAFVAIFFFAMVLTAPEVATALPTATPVG